MDRSKRKGVFDAEVDSEEPDRICIVRQGILLSVQIYWKFYHQKIENY